MNVLNEGNDPNLMGENTSKQSRKSLLCYNSAHHTESRGPPIQY